MGTSSTGPRDWNWAEATRSDRTLEYLYSADPPSPVTTLWTYPWTLRREGVDDACERITSMGFDGINLASHYHSVRGMQPRFPDAMFERYPGGCWFDPDSDEFADTAVEPPVNRLDGWDDPLAEVAHRADDHGLDVNAWTVLMHNSRLGHENPAFRVRTAFGDAHDNSLCPSYPDVREYFAAVVRSVVDRGVAEVQFERLGYPSVFHGHGHDFGHDKRMALTSDTEEALASQCFCDGCRRAAADHAVDLEAARELVRELLTESFAAPHTDPPELGALVARHPTLADLFDFRASVVTRHLEALREAAGSVPINCFAMNGVVGSPNASGWSAGVRFDDLEPLIERATAICYVADPAEAVSRVRTLDRNLDVTVDAGVTLNPSVIDSREQLLALVGALKDAVSGRLQVYHDSFLTDAQLEWVEAAV